LSNNKSGEKHFTQELGEKHIISALTIFAIKFVLKKIFAIKLFINKKTIKSNTNHITITTN